MSISTQECTPERFARDIAKHVMTVIRADDTDRHLLFTEPGNSNGWFELVTWTGALCIRGDYGTFVFSRVQDMFSFFRSNHGGINPSYWSEKVQAADQSDGMRAWSQERFKHAVVGLFRDYWRDSGHENHEQRRECWEELRRQVLSCDGEILSMAAAYDFSHGRFRLEDFWENSLYEYTFRFIWCCRAIVWGIQQFDAIAVAKEVA